MKKWKSLIAILIVLMANDCQAQLILERSLLLSNYPSGSSIEYTNNKLFLIGDDATHLMILNQNYNKVDSNRFFKGDARISKNKKIDIESSTAIPFQNIPRLMLLGSSSTKRRQQIYLFPVNGGKVIESFSIKRFNKRVMNLGVNELNYEGLAATTENIIISNRGHLANPTNQFIITDLNFWSDQKRAEISIINIDLEKKTKAFAGISGLTYVPAKDIMLFTASTENTSSTYGDGEISDSYIGWISNFSMRKKANNLTVDGLINLSENNQTFAKQKIESVTLQEVQGNTLILHLVADNDNGQSRLFKVRLSL